MDITISYQEFQKDIKVNRKQKIEQTISVLKDNGIINLPENENYMAFSERNKTRISKHLTYEQACIYTGDILWIRGECE